MSLPAPEVKREALHTRTIRVDAYARSDGQWDLEAELIDVKHYDFAVSRSEDGLHRAGDPIHHMLLRVTFDESFTITDTQAGYQAAPYGPQCSAIESAYQGMVGMNLLKNFRDTMKRRFSRTAGCTHMTELSYVLPTAAVQALAGRRREKLAANENERPFQLDGCHAYKLTGPIVKEFYPKWYIAPVTED